MKERLVDDWLISINERGYEVPFCQSLIAKGYQVLRSGHSPTEHGKDVITISPDGYVCAYQLKTGDFGQDEVNNYLKQINMLVEARPVHPALPLDFIYRPYLVTTGEFKPPAISLINELNVSWQNRRLPALNPINGRQLHVEFVNLSSDFWPTEPPSIRRFRELYLADGRGDLDLEQFAKFLLEILRDSKSGLDLERRVSAANIFSSYVLSEFYKQQDHWSVFQGWVVCAAQIAWAGESKELGSSFWRKSFSLAKDAAMDSLRRLTAEVLDKDALLVRERELDDFTRARNTVALAGACCWQLISKQGRDTPDSLQLTLRVVIDLIERGRFFPWGEGAISHFLMLVWLLENGNNTSLAKALLMNLIEAVSIQNARDSEEPLENPYSSPDACLTALLKGATGEEKNHRPAVNSYSLFPMVLLAARRGLRTELQKAWPHISRVALKWFEPNLPVDNLLWHCAKGKECTDMFRQPQSWRELREIAFRDGKGLLPHVLRDDVDFGLMFLLAFPHRITPIFVRHMDAASSTHAHNTA